MRLIVAHVGEEGWARDAPKSIYRRVSTATLLSAARRDLTAHLFEQFQAAARSIFPDQTYCWGFPYPGRYFFERMNAGDVVIFASRISSSVGVGDMEALACIDYVAPDALPKTSAAVWGSSYYPLMYFFRERTLLSMPWEDLLRDVGWAKNLNLRGLHRHVATWRVQLLGDLDAYVGRVKERYSVRG